MIRITFVRRDETVSVVEATPGETLLAVAQADDQPLEGTCEGQMACATCHVILAPRDFDRLPPPTADEEDMLDLAYGATRNSRLACQIVLDNALGALEVRIPAASRDMRGG